MASADSVWQKAIQLLRSPKPITCSDWADKNFYLSSESSNTSGRWKTTVVQRAILNAFGNDAIEKVDFFKPTRFGGTKMDIAAMFYFIAHKRRNVGFYQPTDSDRDEFVKSEIQPAIRDCKTVYNRLINKSDKNSDNTLSFKAFKGCNAFFKGGHTPKSYERMTLDCVIGDEIDQFSQDVGGKGDPVTLMWARIRNSHFKKQILTSKPTVKGFSQIEKSSGFAQDILVFQAKCPCCGEFSPIEWGGKDVAHGFKFEDGDASSVVHICKNCGDGWGNNQLHEALKDGWWLGEKGYKTHDGISWTLHGEPVDAPRHIAFKTWSGYSQLTTWKQLVEEWFDAKKDIKKIQAFTNNVLAEPWDIEYSGTLTEETINGIIPTSDLSRIIAVTAGIDTQDDRIEIQYVGHDKQNNIYILDYSVHYGDMNDTKVYNAVGNEVINVKFDIGNQKLGVMVACMDTQGHYTANVHEFLIAVRKYQVFVGINGTANATYEIADQKGHYEKVKDSEYYSIGVNVIKQKVFSAIKNYDGDRNALRISQGARLPANYSKQLTAEKMEVKTVNGKNRVVFTNKHKQRNEALDTLVYALAGKAHIKKSVMGRKHFGE